VRTGAQKRGAVGNCTEENDVRCSLCGLAKVATGKRSFVLRCQGQKSIKEASGPGFGIGVVLCWLWNGEFHGETEGKKGGYWPRPHGSKIAKSASESAMADSLRRMSREAEVPSIDAEIGGDGKFFAGTNADQCAIISYSET
jgi:hypothetical protein